MNPRMQISGMCHAEIMWPLVPFSFSDALLCPQILQKTGTTTSSLAIAMKGTPPTNPTPPLRNLVAQLQAPNFQKIGMRMVRPL